MMGKHIVPAVVALALCASGSPASAVPVADATFIGQIILAIEPVVPEVIRTAGIIQDEQAVWDGFVTQSLSGVVQLVAGQVPRVVTQGEFDHVYAPVNVGGIITYWMRVDATDPDAPAVSVPLMITGQSQASAQPRPVGGETLNHSAAASLQFGKYDIFPKWETLQSIVAQVSWPDHVDGQNLSVQNTFTRYVPVGETWGFKIMAYGGSSGGAYTSGVFSALADPSVEIDPAFLVEVRGQMVPASQVYAISYSPNIAPEPSDTAGILTALAALAALRALFRGRNTAA